MKIKVEYEYWESYLPSTRHRKLRYREVKGETEVTIQEASKNDVPIAFLVHGRLSGEPTEYRFYKNELWKPIMWNDRVCRTKGLYPVEEFLRSIKYHNHFKHLKTKEEAEAEKHDYVASHLIIDGVVYGIAGEPRYVINTFGLGNNHGGTGMFAEEWYNSNISHKRYFNALQREAAIKEADRIASSRGDTNDVGRFAEACNIEVFIPSAVRCNPSKEHGDGDPFLNKLDAITEMASSTGEAGFLSMMVLANELEATK